MNSKKLGLILLIMTIILAIILGYLRFELGKSIQRQIDVMGPICTVRHDIEECPHEKQKELALPTFIGGAFIAGMFILSIYLMFFDRKKIVKEEIKEYKDNKFDILLSALDDDEKKVIKAVKEQDGILQSTLRIRTDLSKTKLSLVLKGLENKGLVKKVLKGKTNQIFLKKKI